MGTRAPVQGHIASARPWYSHRWPWLLALGPAAVIVAGIHTTWIAFSKPDALVVDDYYKQGKAINQDLRRDRAAAALKLRMELGYHPARGKLSGHLYNLSPAQAAIIVIKLVHPTQPEKDLSLVTQPDRDGNFEVDLPMLELGRWQVTVENDRRDWRLKAAWLWPQQQKIELGAE